jgi:hypothetical protein
MIYLIAAILGCLLVGAAANYTGNISFAVNSNMSGTKNISNTNTTSGNMTNSIGSNMSDTTAAQSDIREGMNSLKSNDTRSAIDHFNSAVDSLSNSSSSADVIRNLRQGIKALESGDQAGAIGSLEIANKGLGQ